MDSELRQTVHIMLCFTLCVRFLLLMNLTVKKHSGIIAEFRKRYIKNGIFNNDISNIIGNQFDIRTHSDYDDFYVISKNESLNQLAEAEKMVAEVENCLNGFYNTENI